VGAETALFKKREKNSRFLRGDEKFSTLYFAKVKKNVPQPILMGIFVFKNSLFSS